RSCFSPTEQFLNLCFRKQAHTSVIEARQTHSGSGKTMSEELPIIYLARHGETAWSLTGQHTGLTDLPLTERPGWLLFRDGCPGGESPAQASMRADRVVHRLRAVQGTCCCFPAGISFGYWRRAALDLQERRTPGGSC